MLLCGLLLSCSGKEEERDASVLDEDRFVELLTDARLLEGAYAVRYHQGERADMGSYYVQVFERHQVTEESFRAAMLHYSSRPEEMEAIEERVLEKINRLMAGQGLDSAPSEAAEE